MVIERDIETVTVLHAWTKVMYGPEVAFIVGADEEAEGGDVVSVDLDLNYYIVCAEDLVSAKLKVYNELCDGGMYDTMVHWSDVTCVS